MAIRFKNSTTIFTILIVLNIIITSVLAINYKDNNDADCAHLLKFFGAQINDTFESIFFSVKTVEAIVMVGHDNFEVIELDKLITPIVEQYGVRNVSILPNGIVEYIYPYEGNEEAIGDNIFEMPIRKNEANIAIQSKEIIMSGPYALTQGGVGMVARKAIFIPNEDGIDELWGMVSIVMDAPSFLNHLDLDSIIGLGYEYELSSNVNGLEKTIIQSSDNFESNKANHVYIGLPNGNWQLSIKQGIENTQIVSILFVFSLGFLLSITTFIIIKKNETAIDIIKEEAFIDNLTGLYNRKILEESATRLNNREKPYTIFYIDLNDFKLVNDMYGHNIGDKLLVAVSNRMKKNARDHDLVIRVGGDEFIVILEDTYSVESINKFRTRLNNIQKELFVFGEVKISSNLSYGYARFPLEAETWEEVLKIADNRMYENKKLKKHGNSS